MPGGQSVDGDLALDAPQFEPCATERGDEHVADVVDRQSVARTGAGRRQSAETTTPPPAWRASRNASRADA